MIRTPEQESFLNRCRADGLKSADQLVSEQRDILCRIAVALGRAREDWDGENLPSEVEQLRLRAEALGRAAETLFVAERGSDEWINAAASLRRWNP